MPPAGNTAAYTKRLVTSAPVGALVGINSCRVTENKAIFVPNVAADADVAAFVIKHHPVLTTGGFFGAFSAK